MIPPHGDSNFVANMEKVLDVYKQPYDPLYPVICMDESPKQLIAETRIPIPAKSPVSLVDLITNTPEKVPVTYSLPLNR